jgi:hypothetical protein
MQKIILPTSNLYNTEMGGLVAWRLIDLRQTQTRRGNLERLRINKRLVCCEQINHEVGRFSRVGKHWEFFDRL